MEKLGPYILQRTLGTGGMGKVYAAVEEETGRKAAVKVLSPNYTSDAHFRARFGTEIQSLKKLRHSGIVELYGFGEQDGRLFYAMELVQGKTLAELIRGGRRFAWQEVVGIGIDVCSALRHAHDHGVIHRDLKPANLMLDENNLVKLTDFGIAKLFGGTQLTAEGGVIGTADYMSPEQALGRPATIRSDLYSLGSLLYAMLARRSPFAASTMAEVIHRLINEEPPPLDHLAPDTPRELAHIIHRLLEKDPEKRIATALAVSNRLSELDLRPREGTEAGLSSPSSVLPSAGEGGDESLSTDLPSDESSARPTVPYRLTSERRDPGAGADHDAVTRDAPTSEKTTPTDSQRREEPSPNEPPPDHFTTVRRVETAAANKDDVARSSPALWPLLTMALLVLGGGGILVWTATRPESADVIYDRIQAAADDGSGRLSRVEPDIERFLDRFPDDPRRKEVAAWKSQLDLQSWLRKTELSAKLGARDLPAPVQRLLSARRLVQSDPHRAAEELQALITLLEPAAEEVPRAPPPESAGGESDQIKRGSAEELHMCLLAAWQELAEARKAAKEESLPHLDWIRQQLRRAEELPDEQARAIWRGIIRLYGEEGWAREEVENARSRLNQTSHPSKTSPAAGPPEEHAAM
jgi:serine/threonine protein kinase